MIETIWLLFALIGIVVAVPVLVRQELPDSDEAREMAEEFGLIVLLVLAMALWQESEGRLWWWNEMLRVAVLAVGAVALLDLPFLRRIHTLPDTWTRFWLLLGDASIVLAAMVAFQVRFYPDPPGAESGSSLMLVVGALVLGSILVYNLALDALPEDQEPRSCIERLLCRWAASRDQRREEA